MRMKKVPRIKLVHCIQCLEKPYLWRTAPSHPADRRCQHTSEWSEGESGGGGWGVAGSGGKLEETVLFYGSAVLVGKTTPSSHFLMEERAGGLPLVELN